MLGTPLFDFSIFVYLEQWMLYEFIQIFSKFKKIVIIYHMIKVLTKYYIYIYCCASLLSSSDKPFPALIRSKQV
jgi:hypothetical protein